MKDPRISGLILVLAVALCFAGCSTVEEAPAPSDSKVTAEDTEASAQIIDISSGIPDETVSDLCKKECFKGFEIVSHDLDVKDEDRYAGRDVVSLDIEGADPSGLIPQTIVKNVEFAFDKSSSEWIKVSENCTSWVVDNAALGESKWKMKAGALEDIRTLMGEGDLYLRFSKSMGKPAFNLTQDVNDPERHPFTLMGNGTLTLVGNKDNVEKKFKFTEGTMTDTGSFILDVTVGSSKYSIDLANDFEPVSKREFDTALEGEVPEDRVYLDELSVFDVKSSDIEGDKWAQKIGSQKENLSPQLSWDPVEGASCYAVLMIDHVGWNWIHWYAITDKTSLETGEYSSKEQGYVGPLPEDCHEFTVYVVALRSKPEKGFWAVDTTQYSENADSMFTRLNTGKDGKPSNVLSYGVLKALFDPLV